MLTHHKNWWKKVFTNLNPLHFDNSVFDIYASILNGACLVPFQKKELLEAKSLILKINKLNCSIWFSVPSLLNFLIEVYKKEVFSKLNIKKMIFGGERFPINSIKKIHNYLNKTEFFNVSGPTECTCICSAHKVTRKEINTLENIPVGNISSYFQYKILSISSKKNEGELCLIGPSISQGYLNNKSLTKEKFFIKGKNYGYKNGDLVKKIKNNLLILGRVDNQIKFMGHRIELEEIENVIIKKYNLSECLVLLQKAKKFPYQKLVCYINPDHKKKYLNSNFFNFSEILPYYMRPEEIFFLKKFRYNKNGKIDRKFYIN